MPIVEEGTNYPPELGYTNWPRTDVRSGFIGPQAMALARGETPVHLAQRIRAGQGPILGQRLQGQQFPILSKIRSMIPPRNWGPWPNPQTEYNIPRPYPRPMAWPAGKNIGRLPSVIADISGASGPERTTHGKMVRTSIHVVM